ncbi:MAG: helix-turn-helix domain-containing protein [Chloroflexota bacterium]
MGEFVSTANIHSEIVITRRGQQTTVTVRGPETHATVVSAPPEGEFLGITFNLGVFMPQLLPRVLKNQQDVVLPSHNSHTFCLDHSQWEIPTFDNVDVFIERLINHKLLVCDPIISDVLRGHIPDLSVSALQYRFTRATGFSQKLIEQIQRADNAITLLQTGVSLADVAHEIGYYDQSHMTNAIKRFYGQTPSKFIKSNR